MKLNLKHLAGASVIALMALGATPAFAIGTDAGDTITNTATLNYQVGSVNQTAINAVNNIIVDRKIVLTVTEVNSAYTSVVPGQNGSVNFFNAAATTFTITNSSNTTIDVGLTAADLGAVTGPFTGTDNFNPSGTYTYYRDDGDGVLDAGDTLVTYIDELAEDASVVVHVVNDIAIARVNLDLAVVSLTGQAREGGTASTQGAIIANTAGANTAGMDTVWADTQGSDDAVAPDGRHSARDGYRVNAPVLTVAKLSRVIEDPINTILSGNAANAKMIPGATVEYCITVTNAAGGSAAQNVGITDILPLATTYNGTFQIYQGGTVSGSVCSGGTQVATYNAGTRTVSGDLGSVAPGTTETVYFRVSIN